MKRGKYEKSREAGKHPGRAFPSGGGIAAPTRPDQFAGGLYNLKKMSDYRFHASYKENFVDLLLLQENLFDKGSCGELLHS